MYKNWEIIDCIENKRQHESTDTDINVHIKKNAIRNISLNIFKDISVNDYGAISTIDKNAENVKWKSGSYTLQYSHKIARDVIKDGEFVCDVVYLNIFANFNQWYTFHGEK